MKIGIIGINIYVRAMNYACPLHVYAFQEFLTQRGYDAEIIDYLPNTNKFEEGYDPRHPSVYFENKANGFKKEIERLSAIEGQGEKIKNLRAKYKNNMDLRDKYLAIYTEREDRYDKQQQFIEEHLILSEDKLDCARMEIKDPGYDCYICVTDIIWDKFAAMGYEPGFFLALSCMENKWKIAYSASKLVVKDEKDRMQTTEWIRDMDFVSVREDFLQKEVQEHIRPDVPCVLDPVLLHGAEFYENIMVEPEEDNYLLLYYVVESNPDIILCALDYAKKHNLKIIELTDKLSQNDLTKNQDEVEVIYKYGAGLQEWIGYFRNANCVFTNSFHGCCLSIIFEKNFFVGRRNNYDKITAILNTMDLMERLIDGKTIGNIPETISNWDSVRERLARRRKESECFLVNALTVAQQQPHPTKDYLSAKKNQTFPMYYNVGKKAKSLKDNILFEYQSRKDSLFVRKNSVEFLQGRIKNDETSCFHANVFQIPGHKFIGWRIRVQVDYHKFYLLEDGSFQENYSSTPEKPYKIYLPGDKIPVFPLNRIQLCVAEAVWKVVE